MNIYVYFCAYIDVYAEIYIVHIYMLIRETGSLAPASDIASGTLAYLISSNLPIKKLF